MCQGGGGGIVGTAVYQGGDNGDSCVSGGDSGDSCVSEPFAPHLNVEEVGHHQRKGEDQAGVNGCEVLEPPHPTRC